MRVRKHANPFNFRKDLPVLQLENIFSRPEQPLHLEIGFAYGEFILEMAKKHLEINFIGMEVREPLVEKLQREILTQKRTNLVAIYASSNVNLSIIPDKSIDHVYIFFPDPWFKTKHHKRRIITPRFLDELQPKLKNGSTLLFQTDVETLYQDTRKIIHSSPYWILEEHANVHTLNATGVASYFEDRCLRRGWPIYRLLISGNK
ncbi:MAG: tRNA (guanosine(46)-N7)-methyltransferase TrmB [Candidatus Margulisiibacteriota bacterium]